MKLTGIPLSKAEPNIKYRIIEINVSEAMRARLRELGVICGTDIIQTVKGRGIALYTIRGSRIALRRETAACIMVMMMPISSI